MTEPTGPDGPTNSGKQISEKTTLIIFIGLAVLAAIIMAFFQFRGDDEKRAQSAISQTPTATRSVVPNPTSASPSGSSTTSKAEPLNQVTSEATATETTQAMATPERQQGSQNKPQPKSAVTTVRPPAKNVTPPPAESDGVTDKPSYIDGQPYSASPQGMSEWSPIRQKFIRGLIGTGNIYEATKGTTSPQLAEELKKLKDGQFSDLQFADNIDEINPPPATITPFSYTESFTATNGKVLTVLVDYVFDGTNPGKWQVTFFRVQ